MKYLLVAIALESLLVVMIKDCFLQPCPAVLLHHVRLLKPLYTHSFPSGDTAMAFAIAGSLMVGQSWRRRLALWGYAVLVAYERMYFGVHFPLDVCVGGLIGYFSAICTYRFVDSNIGVRIQDYCMRWKRHAPNQLVLLFIIGGLMYRPIIAVADVPLSSQETPASSITLSLTDAIRLGQVRSALPQAASARVQQAMAHLKSVSALPTPTVTVAHGVGSDTGGLDEDLLIAQTLSLGEKRKAPIRAARAERDATQVDQQGTTSDLTFTIQSMYYAALRADVELQVAIDAIQTAQAFAKAAEVQFQAGDVAQNQVVRSQMEVTSAQQALNAAETERDNHYTELRSILGIPVRTPLTLSDSLDVTPISYQLPDLLAYGMQHRPDVRATALRQQSLTDTVRGVKAESHPDVFWEARHATLNPLDSNGSSLRVGVSFPLGDLGQHRADVRLNLRRRVGHLIKFHSEADTVQRTETV
ncbi:MAG TPA: phosphatase PAP2 family protein [Armatimonadota bacterium]|nr:phosphatase PAP2 family protein [Armatimonadota bacterium]